jgi:hypothetical protein
MKEEINVQDTEHPNRGHFTIIVNARKRDFDQPEISFEQVVILAFGTISTNPNIVYGVTYKAGPRENREGTMDRGSRVKIKNGMIFNVTQTDKS